MKLNKNPTRDVVWAVGCHWTDNMLWLELFIYSKKVLEDSSFPVLECSQITSCFQNGLWIFFVPFTSLALRFITMTRKTTGLLWKELLEYSVSQFSFLQLIYNYGWLEAHLGPNLSCYSEHFPGHSLLMWFSLMLVAFNQRRCGTVATVADYIKNILCSAKNYI